jgi:CRISPR/Cas system CMR-associated protein Cmr5 small subunit
MYKKKNDRLIKKAEEALQHPKVHILNGDKVSIKDSFSGQTSAFGVTIAMAGLRPALAIYQKETEGCNRLEIVNAIAVMLDNSFAKEEEPGKKLFKKVLECDDTKLKEYKRNIIDCSIALKQVIRTYKLI